MRRNTYNFGPFQLDIVEQVLLLDGRSLPLKPKVFEVLSVLVQNSGRLVCKDELMKQVWANSFVEEGNLSVSIFEIRKVLGASSNGHKYIETVPRRGYRFVSCATDAAERTSSQADGADIDTQMLSRPLAGYPSTTKGSIAVLPFKFIGGPGNEYLGLGMADALITRLSNLRQVIVRPTSAVRKYTGAQDSVTVGRELGVEWVLDGSIQKSRKRIRATVQLVNVVDGVLLWAEKFDEKFTDILAVEDSVSDQVSRALAPKLTGEEKRALTKRYTDNPQAYADYLRGRYFLDKRTTEGCRRSIDCFEQAIAIDPVYALAHAGLAGCYVTLSTILPSQEWISSAERSALSALKLDGNLGEARASLGYVKTRQWNWRAAQIQFKTAIELNPNCAASRASYAIYLAEVGRPSEALKEITKAHALDPLSLTINSQFGSIYYMARRYEKALQQLRRTLEFDSNFAVTHFILGYVLEALGEYEEAVQEYHYSQDGLGNRAEFVACVGRVDAFSGRRKQAFCAIDELKSLSQSSYVQPNLIALIYAALGDNDEAFRWLERAFRVQDEDLSLLKADPRWDVLRGDRRFRGLLRRVGLDNLSSFTSSE